MVYLNENTDRDLGNTCSFYLGFHMTGSLAMPNLFPFARSGQSVRWSFMRQGPDAVFQTNYEATPGQNENALSYRGKVSGENLLKMGRSLSVHLTKFVLGELGLFPMPFNPTRLVEP